MDQCLFPVFVYQLSAPACPHLESVPATYMIQDVVPLLTSSNLDKLSQEKRRSLGNGGQFCNVLRLTLQAVDLH